MFRDVLQNEGNSPNTQENSAATEQGARGRRNCLESLYINTYLKNERNKIVFFV